MNRITREEYNALPKGDYNLCLDRLEGRWLFCDDNDYRMGMAGVALASLKFEVKFYAFELMPNHGHFVLNGTGEQCMKVFSYLKRRFSEQLMKKGRARCRKTTVVSSNPCRTKMLSWQRFCMW